MKERLPGSVGKRIEAFGNYSVTQTPFVKHVLHIDVGFEFDFFFKVQIMVFKYT